MKKTHKWLGVALCAMAFGGSAQAQKLMVVEMQDSADNWSCALSKISAATFLNGQISFGADEGETTTTLKAIDLKGIEKITFVDDPTAVKSVVANPAAKLRVVVMGNTLRVKGYSGPATRLTIVAATGQTIQHYGTWRGGDINIATLTPGVYIAKVGNQTFKFSK